MIYRIENNIKGTKVKEYNNVPVTSLTDGFSIKSVKNKIENSILRKSIPLITFSLYLSRNIRRYQIRQVGKKAAMIC